MFYRVPRGLRQRDAQIQSSRAAVELGFLYPAETTSSMKHGITKESDVYLVGLKTWLARGPRGLDLGTQCVLSSQRNSVWDLLNCK